MTKTVKGQEDNSYMNPFNGLTPFSLEPGACLLCEAPEVTSRSKGFKLQGR